MTGIKVVATSWQEVATVVARSPVVAVAMPGAGFRVMASSQEIPRENLLHIKNDGRTAR
ncbi:hypothetical protein [Mesorhizobium sp. J8]|uniref:hypothetical protein n=1 Tax=Mesorhizobium sp. J8 TaxID=2777475 RepID=UPI0019166D84|nr:hypothetical protein [Mesorhizobium sp. J8]